MLMTSLAESHAGWTRRGERSTAHADVYDALGALPPPPAITATCGDWLAARSATRWRTRPIESDPREDVHGWRGGHRSGLLGPESGAQHPGNAAAEAGDVM